MSTKVNSGVRKSLLAGQAALQHQKIPDRVISFSFAHLDQTQGQTLEHWQQEGLLSDFLNRLRDYGLKEISQCFNRMQFKSYPSFPPKSDFKHPAHITPDAIWACMHLGRKVCIGGHIVNNIFFVVFLDMEHRFWITEKS